MNIVMHEYVGVYGNGMCGMIIQIF